MLGDPRVERWPVGLEVSGQGGMVRVSGGWRGRRGQITGMAEGVHHCPAQFAPVGLSGSLAIKWAWLLCLPAPFSLRAAGKIRGDSVMFECFLNLERCSLEKDRAVVLRVVRDPLHQRQLELVMNAYSQVPP